MSNSKAGSEYQGIEDTSTRYEVLSLSKHGFYLVDLLFFGEFPSSLKKEVESLESGRTHKSLNLVDMWQNIEEKKTRNR